MSINWSGEIQIPGMASYHKMRVGVEVVSITPPEPGAATTTMRLRRWVWTRYAVANRKWGVELRTTREISHPDQSNPEIWGKWLSHFQVWEGQTTSDTAWDQANQLAGPTRDVEVLLAWEPGAMWAANARWTSPDPPYTTLDSPYASVFPVLPMRIAAPHLQPDQPWPPSGTIVDPAAEVPLAIVAHTRDDGVATQVAREFRVGTEGDWQRAEAQGQSVVSPDGISRLTVPAIPAGAASSGQNIEWRVQTKGRHADWSPWSMPVTLIYGDPPTVSVVSPAGTVNSSTARVSWVYEGQAPQASWVVTLLTGGMVVETLRGSGTDTTATLDVVLADGGDYVVRVVATSTQGLASAPAETTFTVTYIPPPLPQIQVTFDETDGSALISVTNPPPIAGETVATAINHIERSVDGGATWRTIGTAEPDGEMRDKEVPLAGALYRAIAESALPSRAVSAEDDLTVEACWLYLTASSGKVLRFRANPEAPVSASREGVFHRMEGRPWPVLVEGQGQSRDLSISVTTGPESSTWQELEQARADGGMVLWRDPETSLRGAFDGPVNITRPAPNVCSFRLIRVAS